MANHLKLKSLTQPTICVFVASFFAGCKRSDIGSESTTESVFSIGQCQQQQNYFQAAIESEQIIICVFGGALYNPQGIQNICKTFGRLNLSTGSSAYSSVPLILSEIATRAKSANNQVLANKALSVANRLTRYTGTGTALASIANFVPPQLARLHTVWASLQLEQCKQKQIYKNSEKNREWMCTKMLLNLRDPNKKVNYQIARAWLKKECPLQFNTFQKCPDGPGFNCLTE